MKKKKVLLMILDGWGEGDKSKADVIAYANTPYIKSLYNSAATCHLLTSGEDVGLPEGQMGNSEVGHLNIGAGRIIYQDFVRINIACKDNSIASNPMLNQAYQYARDNNKAVHFLGLVSDGGVHSSTKHLMKLCDIAKEWKLKKVFIHVCTDGRDTDPYSGKGYVAELQEHLNKSEGKIASLIGRYYTMDRDKRWERVKQGYDLLVSGKGKPSNNILLAMQESYDSGVTDEFIKPIVIVDDCGTPVGLVKDDDVFICFNFRTDRLREITTVLTQKNIPENGMQTMSLQYYTMTRYDESFENVHVLFDKEDVKNTMGEVVSQAGLKQLRIAETEKYPHVTFFFSGGREDVFDGESRVMIPSPKVATYDLKPSMSAVEVKDAVIKEINKIEFDFICLNFANADMVGHTGIYSAIKKALETVDRCVKEVTEAAVANGYSVMITADHGNADFAINPDRTPNTAHSCNPVPCFLIDKDHKKINDGQLCDIAPTLLSLMGIKIPPDMKGKNLLK
ncbi:MAG: 2,3-bisphosphoglycerate-independent phosphoglycerate mutase [Bacteroidota bacterium]